MTIRIAPLLTTAALAVAFFCSVEPVFAAPTSSINTSGDLVSSKPGHQVTYHVLVERISSQGKGKDNRPSGRRFRPDVYVVNEGDEVTFNLKSTVTGVYPVFLEGYDMHGTIRPNEVLNWSFIANKPGIFKLTRLHHPDFEHLAMEGYLVVIPKQS
ncbi:hypothetical protein [Alicyclobacillus sp. SO9]|uniref:hypothetical protein n=1 Tax=Alicyclobacillus sp. SO9 TaxID=2665646 RepID=UPI0018E72271|nr:hypothetical protein [Alicyclobacillus sp. SO9]QQE77775.1 hypothetical protein GI364_17850 [Alicyclobacillus sp. SO9]